MATWTKNSSEFLGALTGFDGRDAFSKSHRFPVLRLPDAGDVEVGRPPLEAQNDVLALVYEILGVLRKRLQDGKDEIPAARALLEDPRLEGIFSKATRLMTETGRSVDSSEPLTALQRAVEGLVTEAYIERIQNKFVGELARSLKVFQDRLEKDRRTRDDWRDELDSGVVLYNVFRPNLWELYRELWDKWHANMARIHTLSTHLQRLDETLKQEEENE